MDGAAGNVYDRGHSFHKFGLPEKLVKQINALRNHKSEEISGFYKQIDVFRYFTPEMRRELMAELRRLQPGIPATHVFHRLKILVGEPNAIEQVRILLFSCCFLCFNIGLWWPLLPQQVTHVDSYKRALVAIIHLTAAPGIVSTEMARTVHPPFDKAKPWPFPWAKDKFEDGKSSEVRSCAVCVFASSAFLKNLQHIFL
jgi:hypothetical protein